MNKLEQAISILFENDPVPYADLPKSGTWGAPVASKLPAKAIDLPIKGPKISLGQALQLLRRDFGFGTKTYSNPGDSATEISKFKYFPGKSKATPFEFMKPRGEFENMTQYKDELLAFLQARVNPNTRFETYRGSILWLARFKVPKYE